MNHADHVRLLQDGIPGPGGVWADLGAGDGAFTLALAELVGPGATLYAVDRERHALRRLADAMQARFPSVALHTLTADFTQPLPLPPLDGLLMANALHFVRDKLPVLRLLRQQLQPAGHLLLVEYDTDRGNRWVPYPLSLDTWQALAARAGFSETRLLATHPSRFLGRFYSAVSLP